jgi:hypothetical protein
LRYEKNVDRIERLARQLEEAAAKENFSFDPASNGKIGAR